MPGEASHFAVVLERIARNALAQFRDISDVDLNSPLKLPESNTAFVLATHLIGSAEYWSWQAGAMCSATGSQNSAPPAQGQS